MLYGTNNSEVSVHGFKNCNVHHYSSRIYRQPMLSNHHVWTKMYSTIVWYLRLRIVWMSDDQMYSFFFIIFFSIWAIKRIWTINWVDFGMNLIFRFDSSASMLGLGFDYYLRTHYILQYKTQWRTFQLYTLHKNGIIWDQSLK